MKHIVRPMGLAARTTSDIWALMQSPWVLQQGPGAHYGPWNKAPGRSHKDHECHMGSIAKPKGLIVMTTATLWPLEEGPWVLL